MPTRLSTFLGVKPLLLRKHGVFDALIGIDSKLFVDPLLLKKLGIPEPKNSRKKFETYFRQILQLLAQSQKPQDVAWRTAAKRLVFRETHGVSLGYGVSSANGSGIGPVLARRLLQTASEMISIGIKDPAIFELLGLFEEGFGPDRLSDMTIRIIRDDLFQYTARVARALGVPTPIKFKTLNGEYRLPQGQNSRSYIVFVPRDILRPLPVAQSWDEISDVVSFNKVLRHRLNRIISKYWRSGLKAVKGHLKATLVSDPKALKELLKGYNQYAAKPYDVLSDPQGFLSWFELGRQFAKAHPVTLELSTRPTMDEIQQIVDTIVGHFKQQIENNGLNIHLFDGNGKPLHERFSQRLFYSVADTYCKANNIDLSPEPNAGNGPVDFKFSTGYQYRMLAEIKLSTNTQLVHGYRTQLPAYEESEKTKRSAYVIIRVGGSQTAIGKIKRIRNAAMRDGRKVPELFVIDGRLKPSASKR